MRLVKNTHLLLPIFMLTLSLRAETLQECIIDTLETNPVILERLKNYKATREDIEVARSGYLPKIDITVATGREKLKSFMNRFQADSMDVYESSLVYTHNIFKGFQTYHQLKKEQARTMAAAYNYVEKANDIAFRMSEIYIELVRQKEILEVEKEALVITEEIFQRVKKLYNAGLTTLSEVNKIEASLSLAKSNLVVQEQNFKDAEFSVQKVLGRFLDADTISRPDILTTAPYDFDEAISYALKTNPSLLVSNYNIEMAQHLHKEKESFYYPSIDISVSQTKNDNTAPYVGMYDKFRAVVTLSYNLFNGLADKAVIQQTISNIHKEIELKNELRRQVVEGLSLSLNAYKKQNERLIHLQEYNKFSISTLELYQKEYDLGRRSLLDLLTSQNDFINSKKQIINAQNDILFSQFRVFDALGILILAVVHDDKDLYAKVGLSSNAVTAEDDTLDITFDKDGDKIADNLDFSPASMKNSATDIHGKIDKYENLLSSKTYGNFFYKSPTSLEFKSNSNERFNELSKNLKNLDLDITHVSISIHQSANTKSQEDASKFRADILKEFFIKNGVNKNLIAITNHKVDAPLYLDRVAIVGSNNNELNSRVVVNIQEIKPQVAQKDTQKETDIDSDEKQKESAKAPSGWNVGIEDALAAQSDKKEHVDNIEKEAYDIDVDAKKTKIRTLPPEPTYEEFIKDKYDLKDIDIAEDKKIRKLGDEQEATRAKIVKLEKKAEEFSINEVKKQTEIKEVHKSEEVKKPTEIKEVPKSEEVKKSTEIKKVPKLEETKKASSSNESVSDEEFIKAVYIMTLSTKQRAENFKNRLTKILKYKYVDIIENSSGTYSVVRRIKKDEDGKKVIDDIRENFKDAWLVHTPITIKRNN